MSLSRGAGSKHVDMNLVGELIEKLTDLLVAALLNTLLAQ